MSDFMDVLQFHKNEQTGKWRRTNLGYAKRNKDGTGWDLYLDALPMPGPNGCRISILSRQDRQQQSGGGGQARNDDLDGSIPF